MNAFALLVLLLVVSSGALAGEMERPQGRNCELSAPPEAAGEEFNHGIILRIFPRARDIDATYSGCQTMWAPNGTNWVPISVTEVVGGDPVRIWSPDARNPALTACRYKKGEVISGVAATCVAPDFLLAKSLAPGCVKKIQAAVAAGGITAPWPAGCAYE